MKLLHVHERAAFHGGVEQILQKGDAAVSGRTDGFTVIRHPLF